MRRLLALAPYPIISADTRYRIAQYIPGLLGLDWQVNLVPFMNDHLYSSYNKSSKVVNTIYSTSLATIRRFQDVSKANRYDAVLLHKEAYPFGSAWMENFLFSRQKRIIYDMDDAFWSHPPQFKQIGRFLRDPDRIKKILRLSCHVLAGNEYLANYAKNFNSTVTVFPTVIDIKRYLLRTEIPDDTIIIGWVGRWSSSDYLASLTKVFENLSLRNPKIKVRLVGAGPVQFPPNVKLEILPWKIETEIEDIIPFDIGIMPLPDDEYSQGKCGFKLLQYMALGIPAVASPIGVNTKIVKDGINGFLAKNENEWEEKLSFLIEDRKLRKEIGENGRTTVEDEYSLQKALPVLANILNHLVA